MGEIDKSNPSVRTAPPLNGNGDRSDQKPHRSNSCDLGCEKDIESLSKDFSRWKMNTEARDGATVQVRHSLENYQKMVGELSTLLRTSETERNRYMDECVRARIHIHGLESKLKEMGYQASHNEFLHMQLSHALSELKAAQVEVVGLKGELAVARDSEFKAIKQAESMAAAADMEREKTRQLVQQVKELNGAILGSHLAAIEAEKEKFELLSQKDSQIQLARTAAVQAQEQLGTMRKQIEVMKELHNLKMGKTALAESVQSELKRTMILLNSLEEDTPDVSISMSQPFADMGVRERKNIDQSSYVEALETEINQLKLELSKAKEEISSLNCKNDALQSGLQLQEAQTEMNFTNEAQLVKSFRISQMDNDKPIDKVFELANTLMRQHLALEEEEIRQENGSLHDRTQEQGGEAASIVDLQYHRYPYNADDSMIGGAKRQVGDEKNDEDINGHITISLEEYEYLIRKAATALEYSTSEMEAENQSEVALLKKELQVTTTKMRELRNRAEQALSRAESAEKAKAILEQQINRWREKKEKRKAAVLALRQEFTPKLVPPSSPPYDDASPYDTCSSPQPLGRILSMNF